MIKEFVNVFKRRYSTRYDHMSLTESKNRPNHFVLRKKSGRFMEKEEKNGCSKILRQLRLRSTTIFV